MTHSNPNAETPMRDAGAHAAPRGRSRFAALAASLLFAAANATAQTAALTELAELGADGTVRHVDPAPDAVTATGTVKAIKFATATVGTTAPQTLVAKFTVSGYSGHFTPTAAMHAGRDYTIGSASCVKLGASKESCSFPVTFEPTLPGARKDALNVLDGSTVLATVFVYGTGNAPLAALNPGVETQAAFPEYAYNSAIDEDGTAYVLDNIGPSVYSYTKAGVLTKLPVTLPAGPNGIAIDGAGKLYIALNTYSSQIITYDTVRGVQGAVSVVPPPPYVPCGNSNGGALSYLYSVAVDGAGDLYALEILCGQIFELKTNGTYTTFPVSPTMIQPSNITVDSAGDVFIGGYAVNERTAAGVETQINTVGAYEGIAVDAAKIVYATRYLPTDSPLNVGVALLQPSGYATAAIGLEPGNAAVPLGIGLGSDGTAYIGDYTNLDIIDRTQGSLDFGLVTAGVQSPGQSVQMVNIGNKPLTVTSFALVGAPGYSIQASASPACKNGSVLAPGAYCTVTVALDASGSGTWPGSLVFTTNSLGVAGTTRTVALTGRAI